MAKKTQKVTKEAPSKVTSSNPKPASRNQAPPNQLMDLVESFLSDQGFDNAHREFQKHRVKKGWKGQDAGKQKDKEHHSLVSVFQTWKTFSSQTNTPVLAKEDPMQKITKVSSSESDSSDDSSSESEDDSDDPNDVSMADASVADEASSSESSSSSESESDSDSDGESESGDEEETPAIPTASTAKARTNPLKRKAESEAQSKGW